MSEFNEPAQMHVDTQAETPKAFGTEETAGSLLRRGREASGIHIAALAVALKVPVKKLEALEADRHDLLPDIVFVRALAASVCRTLKLDTARILDLLPRTGLKLAPQNQIESAPFQPSSGSRGPSIFGVFFKPAVLAGLALVAGALVLILLPDNPISTTTSAAGSGAAAEAQATALGAQKQIKESPAMSLPVAVPLAAASGAGAQAPAELKPDSAPQPLRAASAAQPPGVSLAAAPASKPLASATATAVPSVSAAAAVASAPGASSPLPAASGAGATARVDGLIVFTAKSASWVQVTDARREVVLRRLLNPGEVVAASGVPPLSTVVGRADAIQVQVRGQPFDLAAVARENVARFEVK